MGKASFRKRLQREQRVALQGLRARVELEDTPPGTRWVQGSEHSKISAALGELIEPYVSDRCDLEDYRKLTMLGAMAWNWAVEPDLVSRDRLLNVLPSEFRALGPDLCAALDDIRLRKVRLFPDDQRLIVGTEVHEQSDGSFFLVAAAAGYDDGQNAAAPP